MRDKALVMLVFIFFLSGCATYRYQHGTAPFDKGYVVSRDDYTILEYTVGKDSAVPDRALAKERFKRRKTIVEDYYKRIGYIDNNFKMAFWDPVRLFVKMIGGTIWFVHFGLLSDYRYHHDQKYKEKIGRLEAEKDAMEEKRINGLKESLALYIQTDIKNEELAKAARP
ncbi:MAG TPA: hypothetical protein VI976_00855 [Candidatus Omnitrophota bacterium]|nr:hypothetical protein [Candidatus Omnitrophota bacterium]